MLRVNDNSELQLSGAVRGLSVFWQTSVLANQRSCFLDHSGSLTMLNGMLGYTCRSELQESRLKMESDLAHT